MSSIQRTVKRAGITRKRLTQIADARSIQYDAYDAQRQLFDNNIDSVVSIDETCFYSTDHSRYGYSLRGKRARTCVNRASMSRTKVSLLLATTRERIIGFQVYTGTCNSANLRSLFDRYPCQPVRRYSWITSHFIKRELFVRKRRQRVRRYSLHRPISLGTTQWKRPFRYLNTVSDGRLFGNERFQQWRRKSSLIS